jgi:hypothetical protein
VSNTLELTEEQRDEMNRYKQALREYYASRKEVCIIYERNIPTLAGQHLHLQIINMSPQLAATAHRKFVSEGKECNLEFQTLPTDKQLNDVVADNKYIAVELPDDSTIYAIVKDKNPKAFEFARQSIASVLNKPDRANWKHCVLSDDQELEAVETFKSNFQKYDFTLE